MSGGVDSTIAAYLLQQEGYTVAGITMQNFSGNAHIKKAKEMAKALGIDHYVVNVEEEFRNSIISCFCREYINGRTPNPCVRCNRLIKFGFLMNSKKNEWPYFATGHYARVENNAETKQYLLRKGKDIRKDQSYVLHMLNQEQLSRLLLPLGGLSKKETFAIARELKLPIAEGGESQDICFIPEGDYVKFILSCLPAIKLIPGPIKNRQGEILGTHKGLIFYTIGQRKGLGIGYKCPLFVVGIDKQKNTLIVGEKDELSADVFKITDVLFTNDNYRKDKFNAQVKIRYHHQPSEAKIKNIGNNDWQVKFQSPQKAITPGQSAVFYDNDIVLGGGVIESVIDRKG